MSWLKSLDPHTSPFTLNQYTIGTGRLRSDAGVESLLCLFLCDLGSLLNFLCPAFSYGKWGESCMYLIKLLRLWNELLHTKCLENPDMTHGTFFMNVSNYYYWQVLRVTFHPRLALPTNCVPPPSSHLVVFLQMISFFPQHIKQHFLYWPFP